MGPKKAISYLIIAFLVGILISTSFYYFVIIDNIQKYEIQLEVGKVGGFNVATDKLYFGILPAGGVGKRTLELYGRDDRDTRVFLDIKGELKPWIRISDNDFILPKNTTKNITISMIVPKNATMKNYSSEVIGKFHRVW